MKKWDFCEVHKSQKNTERERQRDRKRERVRKRERDRKRERERQRERDTEREIEKDREEQNSIKYFKSVQIIDNSTFVSKMSKIKCCLSIKLEFADFKMFSEAYSRTTGKKIRSIYFKQCQQRLLVPIIFYSAFLSFTFSLSDPNLKKD